MSTVTDLSRPDLGGNLRHGDIHTACPMLWAYFIERYALRSMLDVGCGEGHAVAFFHRAGLFAHGIDGLQTNIARAVVPIARHDILSSSYYMPVDFVWSSEVAEHILPEKVNNYIETLCNGTVIAMTHAVPGQGGYHHVNCQPSEYWIELMAVQGYTLSPDQEIFRDIASKERTWNYFSRSGLVFVKS